jgi:hypothetical protein
LSGSRPVERSWLQTQCEERWGTIFLPNLHAIMTMILGVIDREGITKVRFHPSQSRLFALGLEGGLVPTPYAFNVVSRFAGLWYVDDIYLTGRSTGSIFVGSCKTMRYLVPFNPAIRSSHGVRRVESARSSRHLCRDAPYSESCGPTVESGPC